MKKLLSIMLTVALLASVFVLPAGAFVPTRGVLTTPDTIYLNQDFSDVEKTDFTRKGSDASASITPAAEVSNGKAVYTPQANSGYMMQLVSDASVEGATSYIVEFDIMSNLDIDFTDATKATHTYNINFASLKGDKPYVFHIIPVGLKANVVRTYKLIVDLTSDNYLGDGGGLDVSFKDAGDSGFTDLPFLATFQNRINGQGPNGHYRLTAAASTGQPLSTAHNFNLASWKATGTNVPFTGDIAFTLDNIKIYTPGSSESVNYTTNGVIYSNDCEDSTLGVVSTNKGKGYTYSQGTEATGNKYYTYTPTVTERVDGMINGTGVGVNSFLRIDTTATIKAGDIFTVDLKAEVDNCAPPRFNVYNAAGDASMQIILYKLDKDVWYTYKIDTTDGIGYSDIKVYRKPRGAADSEYVILKSGPSEDYNTVTGGTSKGAIAVGAYGVNDHLDVAQFSFDNLQIREKVAYSSLSATKSAATLFVETEEANETVIMASYDGYVLKDVNFVNLTGATNKAELGVTAGNDATQIYVWSSLVGGKPILTTPITIN